MKPLPFALLASLAAAPLAAQEDHRALGAHVHGVSKLELAVEHGHLAIDLTSPGMDITGFEYAAGSAADKDAVEAAILQLARPSEIIALPAAAGCRVTEVLVHLHSGEHDHDEEHAHAEDEEHEHEDHAEDGEHEEHGTHSEFHAAYEFACEDEDALDRIDFPFFALFPGAQEIEAAFVTETGAGAAEIGRGDARLTLE